MKLITIITVLIGLFVSTVAVAAVSSSTNYSIEVDSLNFSGGTTSSATYNLDSTAGEVATGDSSSTAYNIAAGYQAMLGSEVTLSITSPSDVTLSPSIGSGEQSNATVSWTVATNNSAGYSLAVKASTNPAMKNSSGGSIPNYPINTPPDFTWTLATDEAYFGYSPEGSHITSRFKDDGTTCGTGSSDTSGACWQGFSTGNQTIASSNSSTGGTQTTLKLRAELGNAHSITAGDYSAVVTVTASTL